MNGGWEILFGLGALALAIALAYGVYQARHAGRGASRAAEIGARQVYDSPGESDQPPRGRPRRRVPGLIWIIVGLLAIWLAAISVLQFSGVIDVAPRTESSAPRAG